MSEQGKSKGEPGMLLKATDSTFLETPSWPNETSVAGPLGHTLPISPWQRSRTSLFGLGDSHLGYRKDLGFLPILGLDTGTQDVTFQF